MALFGSVMLSRYHDEFLRLAPSTLPAEAMPYLTNPILLAQSRPQLTAIFAKMPDGLAMANAAIVAVRSSLLHGLQEVFFAGAVVMTVAILPHVFLKREPLRTRVASPSDTPPAH